MVFTTKGINSIRIRDERIHLAKSDYIPGTLKRWRSQTYYIPSEYKQAYFDLCMALFRREGGRADSLEDQLKKNSDKLDELKSQQLLPP